MRYTIEIKRDGQVVSEIPNCTKSQAKKYAQQEAINQDVMVFVTFFRASDGQHGYLNPDGNYAITGEAW